MMLSLRHCRKSNGCTVAGPAPWYTLGERAIHTLVSRSTKNEKWREVAMRSTHVAGFAFALAVGGATITDAAEIRLAEQFSMGYLQFNVMKRDRLIEKYATQRGL